MNMLRGDFRQALQYVLSAVILILAICGSAAVAQNCPTCIQNLTSHPVGKEVKAADGKIHITYGFSTTVSNPKVKMAFEKAIAQWNGLKDSTGVVFDSAPAGTTPDLDLTFSGAADENRSCAFYKPNDENRIRYGTNLDQAINSSGVDYGATVFAHELGHVLGLDEATSTPSCRTIMNNPLFGICGNVATTTVQSADAIKAKECVKEAIAQQNLSINNGTGTRVENIPRGSNCYDQYLVTDVYKCGFGFASSSCVYSHTTYQYIGTICY
jgi:hypothetical protein